MTQGEDYEEEEPADYPALPAASTAQHSDDREKFIAAESFDGARSGYVFSKGAQGVGYYIDAGSAGGEKVLSGAAAAAQGRKKAAGAL